MYLPLCYPNAIAIATPVPAGSKWVAPTVAKLSVWIILLAGRVQNTVLVPAPQSTRLSLLLEFKTVVLANKVPEAVYVPTPTSKSVPSVHE